MAGINLKLDLESIKKVQRLRRGTGVTFTRFSKSVGRKVANKHKPRLLKDLRYYPPERPNQKYKRTFRLRKDWDVGIRTPKTGVIISVDNKTPYTSKVVGKPDFRIKAGGKGQDPIHRGRWWIAGGVVRKHYNNIQNDYINEMLDTLETQADIKVTRRSKLIK